MTKPTQRAVKTKEPPKKISKEEMVAKSQVTLRVIGLLETGMYCGTAVVIAFIVAYWGIYKPIEVGAGKQTALKYALDFVFDMKVHVWLAWGTTLAASAWAVNERRLRTKERKVKDGRIEKLERAIDPNRTSSGLDVVGESVKELKK